MGCVSSRPAATLDEKRALLAQYASQTSRSMMVCTTDQLERLRKAMRTCGINAYVIGTEDAHASEYTAESDRRLSFISGFTGSTATAVVLLDSAHFFTDGRYHVQATEQLDDNWTLHKVGERNVANWPEWLKNLPRKSLVGMDARLVPHVRALELKKALARHEITLTFPEANLVDDVWGARRPAPASAPIYVHPIQFAGMEASVKLKNLRKWMSAQDNDSVYVISALDEVAWLLNLRGASIPCNRTYLF